MFEFGSSLGEARVRRGIELAQVAAETRIRRRYLQALEEERFELRPGSVYAKGFLRAYADTSARSSPITSCKRPDAVQMSRASVRWIGLSHVGGSATRSPVAEVPCSFLG